MVWDFLSLLTLVVIGMGIFLTIDYYGQRHSKNLLAKKSLIEKKWYKKIQENIRQFFPLLLGILIIRAFILQPFRVPTGSLEPTLLPGDMIVVTQFKYGLRSPIFLYKLLSIGDPKRGDIAVFHWPANIQYYFVKRVIGLPGDHLEYHNKVLTVNGNTWHQQAIGEGDAYDEPGAIHHQLLLRQEQLPNQPHHIFLDPTILSEDFSLTVPKDSYFVMGDNRDHSDDSRYWGFLPDKYLVGKASFILFSWDKEKWHIRWNRIGKAVK